MSERSVRIATAFALQATMNESGRLCTACVDALEVSGAGITLMSGTNGGPVCSSDARTSTMEDLQFTLGEGPCRDAWDGGVPVLAPRLDSVAAGRWPAFVESAAVKGIGAVFAYPMQADRSRVGVLTLYQSAPGPLTLDQHETAEELAEVLTRTMLAMVRDETIDPTLDDAVAYRAEIHQATGMVSVQLDVLPTEALARIRAHAYAEDRPIGDVAADIVARRVRFPKHEDDSEGGFPDA